MSEQEFRYGAWLRPNGSMFRAVALDVTEGPKMNGTRQHYLTPEQAEALSGADLDKAKVALRRVEQWDFDNYADDIQECQELARATLKELGE